MKLPVVSIPPGPCATCGNAHYDTGAMTFCDDCDAILCAYCANTITSEDVVCPDCYQVHTCLTKAEARHDAIAAAKETAR